MIKKFIFGFILFLLVQGTMAQTTDTIDCDFWWLENGHVHLGVPEYMPSFPGGETALKDYISDHLKYPPLAVEGDITSLQGRVSDAEDDVEDVMKGLALAELNKDLEQKLRVCWNNDGSFSLKTADGNLVAKNLKGYVKPDSEHEPAKFRAICTGKRQFIITVGSKDFKQILNCSNGGKLVITKFDPRKPSFNWVIN